MSGSNRVDRVVPTVPTTIFNKVFNPYTLKATDSSNKEQLLLDVTSYYKSWMHVAWGVLVSEIYPLIQSSTHQLSESALLSERLSKISLFHEVHHLASTGDVTSYNFCLDKPYLDLGPVPRDRYPLVIIIMTSECHVSPSDIPQDHNKIVGLMSFIHLKDSICTANTHIFDQYVKTVDGRLHSIKAVYVTSEEGSDRTEADGRASRTCLVCMSGPITRVLLPCRHACMCQSCLQKLVYCPVCRSAISSTFDI